MDDKKLDELQVTLYRLSQSDQSLLMKARTAISQLREELSSAKKDLVETSKALADERGWQRAFERELTEDIMVGLLEGCDISSAHKRISSIKQRVAEREVRKNSGRTSMLLTGDDFVAGTPRDVESFTRQQARIRELEAQLKALEERGAVAAKYDALLDYVVSLPEHISVACYSMPNGNTRIFVSLGAHEGAPRVLHDSVLEAAGLRFQQPDFEVLRGKRISELTPAQREDVRELWLRDSVKALPKLPVREYAEDAYEFLLRRLDEARA